MNTKTIYLIAAKALGERDWSVLSTEYLTEESCKYALSLMCYKNPCNTFKMIKYKKIIRE